MPGKGLLDLQWYSHIGVWIMLDIQNGEAKPESFLCVSTFLMEFFIYKNNSLKKSGCKKHKNQLADVYSNNLLKTNISTTRFSKWLFT